MHTQMIPVVIVGCLQDVNDADPVIQYNTFHLPASYVSPTTLQIRLTSPYPLIQTRNSNITSDLLILLERPLYLSTITNINPIRSKRNQDRIFEYSKH